MPTQLCMGLANNMAPHVPEGIMRTKDESFENFPSRQVFDKKVG